MAFDVHKLNALGLEKAKKIQTEFQLLLEVLGGLCDPNSRRDGRNPLGDTERHLELACFYAKRAMARCKENQE